MRREVIVLLALCSCRDLPVLFANECGNGVVEAGEDCDGSPSCAPPDAVAACRFTCADAACPAGWGCGTDAVCRHGTGDLVPGRSVALTHEDLVVADVDGDGIGDLVGFDLRGARVAFADQTIVAVSPDQITGPGAVGDLDGDGRADIATPLALGLAIGRGESDRSVTPVGYAPFPAGFDAWFVPLRVPGQLPGDALAALAPSPTGSVVELFQLPSGPPHPRVPLAPGVTPAQLGPRAIRGDVDAPSAEDELVIASSGHPEVWLLRPVGSSVTNLIEIHPLAIAMPVDHVGDGRVALADLDGDGDLDLVAGTIRDTELGVATAINSGGVLGPLVVEPSRFVPLGQPAAVPGVPAAPQPFPLALADLDGDGDLDAISPDAVFADAGGWIPVYPRSTAAPWREVVTADLDRDGRLDVIAASHLPGLDVLRQGDGGFTRVAIDTAGPIANLRAADFDGDGLADVAFRERTAGGDRIRVLFGAIGAFAPPIPVMGGPAILRFEAGRFRDAAGGFELADDLAITVRDNDRGRLAFVEGAGDRRLRSILYLARGGLAPDVPLGAIAGRFGPGDGMTIAALARTADGARRLWVFPPTVALAYEPDTAIVTTALGELATLELTRLAAADLDGDGLDELIALGARQGDRAAIVVAISPGADYAITVIEPAVGEPVDLAVGDLDRDGTAEIVIAGSTGLARWRAGKLDHAFISAASVCIAQLDADPELELAMVILSSLAIIDADDLAAEPRFFTLPTQGRSVRAGDVDGDRVDDLVVGDGSMVTQYLSVPQVPR